LNLYVRQIILTALALTFLAPIVYKTLVGDKRLCHSRWESMRLASTQFAIGCGLKSTVALVIVFAYSWIYSVPIIVGYLNSNLLLVAIFVSLNVAIIEEVIFRGLFVGFPMGLKIQRKYLFVLIVFQAWLFTAFHDTKLNSLEEEFYYLVALFCSGMTYGLMRLASGNLWMPIGAHFGWNLVAGVFLGVGYSGLPKTTGLLSTSVDISSVSWPVLVLALSLGTIFVKLRNEIFLSSKKRFSDV
jgi:membrane protease YdiL (CAAX protease family)